MNKVTNPFLFLCHLITFLKAFYSSILITSCDIILHSPPVNYFSTHIQTKIIIPTVTDGVTANPPLRKKRS